MVSHSEAVRVRYVETDQMGFAHHAHYLAWFEAARVGLLDTLGLPYREMEARGWLLPVLSYEARFHRSARFDDRLRVTVRAEALPRVRFELRYLVERGTEKLAQGRTEHAFINPQGQPMRPPEAFLALFRPHFATAQAEGSLPK